MSGIFFRGLPRTLQISRELWAFGLLTLQPGSAFCMGSVSGLWSLAGLCLGCSRSVWLGSCWVAVVVVVLHVSVRVARRHISTIAHAQLHDETTHSAMQYGVPCEPVRGLSGIFVCIGESGVCCRGCRLGFPCRLSVVWDLSGLWLVLGICLGSCLQFRWGQAGVSGGWFLSQTWGGAKTTPRRR